VEWRRPLLGKGLVNTFPRQRQKMEVLLETVFAVGSAPRLHDEDPRPDDLMIQRINDMIRMNEV
jgi:hypothetical protein